MIEPILLTAKTVPKGWGEEIHIVNNDEFCGKILRFNQGARFSCHFHVKKREVFYITKGLLQMMWIDLETAAQHIDYYREGDIIEIPRLLPHQITALGAAELIEFSTPDSVSDSYRVLPGDSQKPVDEKDCPF